MFESLVDYYTTFQNLNPGDKFICCRTWKPYIKINDGLYANFFEDSERHLITRQEAEDWNVKLVMTY